MNAVTDLDRSVSRLQEDSIQDDILTGKMFDEVGIFLIAKKNVFLYDGRIFRMSKSSSFGVITRV